MVTYTNSVIDSATHFVLLQVAHMTKNELEYLDTVLIGPAMLFLNQYFNFFIKEYIVLWLCLVSHPNTSHLCRCQAVRLVTHRPVSFQVWVSFDLLRYSAQVCLEICDHLKIELFRIPYNKGLPSTPAMSFSSASGGEKNGMGSQHHSGRLGGRGGRGTRKQHH